MSTADLSITMTRDEWADLAADSDSSHALRAAIVAAQAGEPLSELLFECWDNHYPIIDGGCRLTGDAVAADGMGDTYAVMSGEAAIRVADALAAGWTVEGNYATPPAD